MKQYKNKNRVAIAVPWFNRDHVLPEEEISIQHLNHFLGDYDKYLIIPSTIDLEIAGLNTIKMPDKYFGSVKAHNLMLLSKRFYKHFLDYEYLLIYHPDALVFSDELEYWCDQGYDYIGPPWIPHSEAPYHGDTVIEGKVGNTGFSLRKVKSLMEVINSKKVSLKSHEELEYDIGDLSNMNALTSYIKRLLVKIRFFPLERRYSIDDTFWGIRASNYVSSFNVAPLDVALQFAFEFAPRHCYELNNHKLPFGCHAWTRYDKEFWEQFTLTKKNPS